MLPDTVQVGPHRYSLVVDSDAMARVMRDERACLLGNTNFAQLCMTIDPDQAPDQLADTILHEVLHAVVWVTNLDSKWGPDRTEDVVQRLTPVLLDVLRRNADLVAFLAEVA